MAKKAKAEDAQDASTEIPESLSPKLRKLIIRNFGCISGDAVSIDLDDIVVLVGPNNSGKSSILRAYDIVFSSSQPTLELDDFPDHKMRPEALPEIELHTAVTSKPPGHCWIAEVDGENIIRERWTWSNANEKAVRQGFDVQQNQWVKEVPWGAPNVANSRRPKPHRVDVFASPEKQTADVTKILMTTVTSNLKSMEQSETLPDGSVVETDYGALLKNIGKLQMAVVEKAEDQIKVAEEQLTSFVQRVFKGHQVKFDARPEENLKECLAFFKAGAQLRMGPVDGHFAAVDRQGSGARRTLMWAALQYAAESSASTASSQPNLLLLDEPELCLHPNAIRHACSLLYDLPHTGRWQVMVTTHSPAFIDLSRDNTTIVRVERDSTANRISGTTVFRPDRVKLSDDEKEELKMLNVCDPHVTEFFFGGRTVIVEGDTEYTAFKFVVEQNPDEPAFQDLHIVRARGKATICLLARILNQFDARFAVLHDSDDPTTMRDGKPMKNPAWTNNDKISCELKAGISSGRIRLVALLSNFEIAILGKPAKDDKPFNMWNALRHDKDACTKVRMLLEALVDFAKPLPTNAVEWKELPELETFWNNCFTASHSVGAGATVATT